MIEVQESPRLQNVQLKSHHDFSLTDQLEESLEYTDYRHGEALLQLLSKARPADLSRR